MSVVEIRDAIEPEAWLMQAMVACLEDDPARPIEIATGVHVRAAVVVEIFAPAALERARGLRAA